MKQKRPHEVRNTKTKQNQEKQTIKNKERKNKQQKVNKAVDKKKEENKGEINVESQVCMQPRLKKNRIKRHTQKS